MKITVLSLIFSTILGCANLLGPTAKQERQTHNQDKLILVNFHSEETVNVWQTAQGYSYINEDWERPNHLNASIRRIQRDYLLTEVDEWPIESLGLYCVVYEVNANESVDAVLEKINSDPRIAFAEPLVDFQLMQSATVGQSSPERTQLDDPLLNVQYPQAYALLEDLHHLGTGNNVKVGIIDSGVDTSHPDLAGRIHATESLINSSISSSLEHGTAVAGIIGANAGNEEGIAGLVPDASLYSYEACGALNGATYCDSFTLAKALEHSLQDGVQVLNLSLAGRETPLLRSLIEKLLASGTILIAAENSEPNYNFPADVNGVIAVGTDMANEFWFANQEQLSTQAGGGYRFFYGTSMSAAGISGFSAILMSIYQPDQVVTILKSLSVSDCDQALSQITFDTYQIMNQLCHRDTKVSQTGSFKF